MMLDQGAAGSPEKRDIRYRWTPRLRATREEASCCVLAGMFDGVHKGHAQLLRAARAHADAEGLQLVAVTFDVDPASVASPRPSAPPLQTCWDRDMRLFSHGVDAVMTISATWQLTEMAPSEFLDFVESEVQVRSAFAGEGLRFGSGRTGDCALLQRHGAARGFDVSTVCHVECEKHEPVTSERVRTAVTAGELELASSLLGVAHEVTVDVLAFHSGLQTAYFKLPPNTAKPPRGRYVGRVRNLGYIPVLVDVMDERELSRIQHLPEAPVDSMSALYASPVAVELLSRQGVDAPARRVRRFAAADRELPQDVQQELAEGYERLEREVIGEGVHEGFHAMLDRLAAKYRR